MTTLFYKIPPNLPLTKGGIIPSLEKRGAGRFSDKCQFNYETLNKDIYKRKRIVCPGIPDEYDFMSSELSQLLSERVTPYINERA
jgi:predicted protein tyrosine phosphatase